MTVKVTLEFATVEEAITGLAGLRKTAEKASDPKPAKTEKAATPAPAASSPGAPAAPAAAPATQPTASPAPSYEPVKAAIIARAKEDQSKVGTVLLEFGAKTGKDLKPEQYADFLAKLEAAFTAADLA